MEMNFCHLCGGPTTAVTTHDGTHWKCQSCGQTYYANPKPASEIILVDEHGRAAVVVRARAPYKGMLDLPGGFIDINETIEHALARELNEELGLSSDNYSTPVYLPSAVDKYPWGQELHSIITIPFTARIDSSVKLSPQDDVQSIEYRTLKSLRPEDFAWNAQYSLIAAALKYWKYAPAAD